MNYEIWLTDDLGNRLELLNTALGFDCALVDGDVGWLNVPLPYDNSRIYNSPRVDQRIQVYRSPFYGRPELVATGFLRRWGKTTDNSGLSTVALGAAGPNELLKRRIAAYYDRTNYTIKDDFADDMMKEIVYENFGGGATDAARSMTALGVSIQSDLSNGPQLERSFAHENVLSVLQDIQQASKALGNETFFKMRADTSTTFVFETYTGQSGRDRTHSTGSNPMLFGTQFGNIVNAQLQELYDSEENYIYAGGKGEGVLQTIKEAGDTVSINRSRWNRREGYVSATNADTEASTEDAAKAQLTVRRAKKMFSADLLPTLIAPFGGNGWAVGDKITVSHLGQQIDALIRAGRISVAANGLETIQARVEAVL